MDKLSKRIYLCLAHMSEEGILGAKPVFLLSTRKDRIQLQDVKHLRRHRHRADDGARCTNNPFTKTVRHTLLWRRTVQ